MKTIIYSILCISLLLMVGCEDPFSGSASFVPNDVSYIPIDDIDGVDIAPDENTFTEEVTPVYIEPYMIKIELEVDSKYTAWGKLHEDERGERNLNTPHNYKAEIVETSEQSLVDYIFYDTYLYGMQTIDCEKEVKLYIPRYVGSRIEYLIEKIIIDDSTCIPKVYHIIIGKNYSVISEFKEELIRNGTLKV